MGVLNCSRNGCEEIMCDRYSHKYGYMDKSEELQNLEEIFLIARMAGKWRVIIH